MKLKTKFFLIFTLLSIIPAFLIFAVVYHQYAIQSQQQTKDVYKRIYESAVTEANQSISEVNHVLESMAFYTDAENSIIKDLKKYKSTYDYSVLDILESNNNLKFLIQSLIYSTDNLNGIFIFTPSGQLLGYGKNIDVLPDYYPTEDSWYKKTLELKGQTYVNGVSSKDFFLNAKPSITFSKALYDVYTHEFLGVLMIDCKPEIFNLDAINSLPEIVLLTIESESGFMLYSNIDSLAQSLPINKEDLQILKTNLNMKGLTLKAVTNPKQLYREFEITQRIILVLSTIYILLFFLISLMLSKYLTSPITYLSRLMANHELNNYVSNDKYLNRTDEIGILFNEYNSMLEEQEKYIKNEYQNKLITLDSQMKSLEAQINSHFLYNTLESINSLAELEGIETISVMSMSLGNMFRYSIKAKSELVTVLNELSNVQDYVSIQSIRFGNKFKFKQMIPPNMYQCRVLKLIFQPIVENALLHGLDRCGVGDTITLTGEFDKTTLYFHIHDNGIGMDEEQVAALQAVLAEPPHFKELGRRSTQSIGLKNISSRIELYYGPGYGLSVSSTKGDGTTISLKLPYIQKEDT